MSARRGSVSVGIIRAIVRAGAAAGLDAPAVLAAAGIDARALDDPSARIPIEREDALWDAMAAASGDPLFGLHAAALLRPGELDVLDYAIRTSPTLGAALRSFGRYNRLLHDVAEIELSTHGAEARLLHRFRGDPRGASFHASDCTLAGIVHISRGLAPGFAVREVRFHHGPPPVTTDYQAFFRAKVVFGAEANELVFASNMLDLPVIAADPALHAVIVSHAEALLAALPMEEDLTGRVRDAIAKCLAAGEPTLAATAKRLQTSARTLQRRLEDAGTSHRALLDGVRRERAISMLSDHRLSIEEVAFVLGYSEARAFHRAFRRWIGQSPGEHRRRGAERTLPAAG